MKNIGVRLNGWQRLWVVSGLVYFLIVVVMSVLSMPQTLTVSEYLGEAVADGDTVPTDARIYIRLDKKWVQVEQIAKNDKTGERIYLLNGNWSTPSTSLEYAKIPHELSEDETWILRRKQVIFTAKALIYWLIPWLLSCLFGLAIAWIISGFRNNKSRD